MEKQENKKKTRHRSKKHAVVMLGLFVAAIWLVLLLFKVLYAHANGQSVDFMVILDGIWDNILGVLPPLILIDLVFEFVTQDYVSEEISEQITGTLMSNPETIRLFDDNTKREFLNATVESIVAHGENEEEMAKNAIAPYIQGRYNLKKYFTYNITLRNEHATVLFDKPEYLTMNETLCFEKHWIISEPLGETFSVGFFTSNSDLDKNLRGQSFLFRESLDIRQEELDHLCALSKEEKCRFVAEDMSLKIYIGHNRCEIEDADITADGIVVRMRSKKKLTGNTAYFEIAFSMPRLKSERIFLAAITEPTYSVNIRFDYPRSLYMVDMYPFFNDLEDALVEDVDRGVGLCDINLRDKWVYPMSGVVFHIESKK